MLSDVGDVLCFRLTRTQSPEGQRSCCTSAHRSIAARAVAAIDSDQIVNSFSNQTEPAWARTLDVLSRPALATAMTCSSKRPYVQVPAATDGSIAHGSTGTWLNETSRPSRTRCEVAWERYRLYKLLHVTDHYPGTWNRSAFSCPVFMNHAR
jgi:hypothetical protein